VDSYSAAYYGLFSVSETGALVYRGGAGSNVLTWFDQHGTLTGTLGEPGDFWNPAVSPDGTRVAVSIGPVGSQNIWIVDVGRNTTTRFTVDSANDDFPVWSPDGKSLVFSSNRTGQYKLYIKPTDGSGEERLLTDQPGVPTSWSKDGRFLLFTNNSPQTAADIWVLPDPGRVSRATKPVPVLATPFAEGSAHFSPDGRWIAYRSNESGTFEIYVRPFSLNGITGSAGAKWLVSKGNGLNPRWRSDGKQLFYAPQNIRDVMAVDIDTSKGFQAGIPRRLFSSPSSIGASVTGWDLAPDDNRFLLVGPPNAGRTPRFTVVLNWQAALKK
jgi:Tol biopolymer transport system component